MNSVTIIMLSGLLLLNFVGLVAALVDNKNLRRRARYLEGAVARAKSLAAQKDATVVRQQGEINLMAERQADLESRFETLRSAAAAQKRQKTVLDEQLHDLQRRHRVLEKTLLEKAARLASIEQRLQDKGENETLKAV